MHPPGAVLNSQQERYVRNESLFREVNERIAEVNEGFEVAGQADFLCECGRNQCLETVQLSRPEYEAVRAEGDRFVVRPGHEVESVERILERHETYFVVEKVGGAGDESEARDPRS
jgi:hypothetical protein